MQLHWDGDLQRVRVHPVTVTEGVWGGEDGQIDMGEGMISRILCFFCLKIGLVGDISLKIDFISGECFFLASLNS